MKEFISELEQLLRKYGVTIDVGQEGDAILEQCNWYDTRHIQYDYGKSIGCSIGSSIQFPLSAAQERVVRDRLNNQLEQIQIRLKELGG